MDKLEQLLLAYFYDARLDVGVEEFVLACSDRNEVREMSAFLRGEASSVRNGDERPFQILQSTVLPDAMDAATAAQFLEDLAAQLDLADAALPC
jgi:hypothetical protein